MLASRTEITMADVFGALSKEGLKESDIEPGDALLFNTGWWTNWPSQKALDTPQPFISREVVDWIIARKPSMIGSDCTLDGPGAPVHGDITMKNGIFNLEWMNFQSLQNEKTYKFLFLCTTLRLKGATGSPSRPVAIF